MGRWLARLQTDDSELQSVKKTEIPPITYRQNRQNPENDTFVSSVSSESGVFQKKSPKSGRWLDRAKKLEFSLLATDKTDKSSSVSFVGSDSVAKQKINSPKVWRLKIKTGNSISTMTVIDPERLDDESFRKSQALVFGADRIIDFHERDTSKQPKR